MGCIEADVRKGGTHELGKMRAREERKGEKRREYFAMFFAGPFRRIFLGAYRRQSMRGEIISGNPRSDGTAGKSFGKKRREKKKKRRIRWIISMPYFSSVACRTVGNREGST